MADGILYHWLAGAIDLARHIVENDHHRGGSCFPGVSEHGFGGFFTRVHGEAQDLSLILLAF